MPGLLSETFACLRVPILVAILLAGSTGATAQALPGVKVENLSEPVLCAEKDNVTLTFSSADVRQFRIEAVHPAYVNALQADSYQPDWTSCDFAADALAQPPPRKVTLYEDIDTWMIGYTFPNFWRDRKVSVRVGDSVHDGLHLIQVWVRRNERSEEVLVLYPADGYWRARPLPPKHLGWSSYGSSFLVGPVEQNGRPVVDIDEVVFNPETMAFDLKFTRGGGARLTISRLDSEAQVIDVAFDNPIKQFPFAALRSMYVTRFNNDAADVAVLETGAQSWREEPVMSFTGADAATSLWLGRNAISRHNTSAPDMVLNAFSDGAKQKGTAAAPPPDDEPNPRGQ